MRNVIGCFLAAAASLAAISPAAAGTSTATSTATFNVVAKCEITGATVNLGTYRTTDTLQTVANVTGYQQAVTYDLIRGTNGVGTVPLGTVTCDAGTTYTITMRSTGWAGSVVLNMPAGIIELYPMVKRIGNYEVPDGEDFFNGFGKWASPDMLAVYSDQSPLGTTADGTPQAIMGNVIPWVYASHTGEYMGGDEQLGVAGSYSGSWVSTLHF